MVEDVVQESSHRGSLGISSFLATLASRPHSILDLSTPIGDGSSIN